MFAAHSQHVNRNGKMPLTHTRADMDPSGKPLASASLQVLHHKHTNVLLQCGGSLSQRFRRCCSMLLSLLSILSNLQLAICHQDYAYTECRRAWLLAVSPVHHDAQHSHVRFGFYAESCLTYAV